MPRPDFAQVLDEKLRESACTPAPPSPRPVLMHQAMPAHPLLFARPLVSARGSAYSACEAAAASTIYIAAPRPTAPPRVASGTYRARPMPQVLPKASCATDRRPHRSLTADERLALEALNEVGAGLGTDFTIRELRSAYRLLARRYHPDRHTGESGDEQTRCARIFNEITRCYRRLASAATRQA